MTYKITGRVFKVGPTINFSARNGNSYERREIVILAAEFDSTTGRLTIDAENPIKFTFFGENSCRRLDDYREGMLATITFIPRGRAYMRDNQTDYFTELRPIRIEECRAAVAQAQAAPEPPADPFGSPDPFATAQ